MAAKSKLNDLNVSLEFSSSASSVETKKSDQEYTDDFHSSLQSSVEEISDKLTEISADYSVDIDDDPRLSQMFVDKKLKVLRENQVKTKRIENLRDDHKDLGPFLLKKVGILRQRNVNNYTNENDRHKHSISNDKCENRRNQFLKFNIKTEVNENQIGCFQSAYERLKFENLREKCRGLLNAEIHSLETCEKCQKLQGELVKDRFYTSRVRNVRQSNIKERFSEHMQNRSSAMLIANIIKDGPKSSWSSDEIWAKLFSGGYQNNQQN